ncbi:MAG: tRNA pseudouridine(38-40) synthase TruA [Propionibacteriaceae bacterium]
MSPARTESTRLRLDISYDGAGFAGWATQPGLRTVQGVLELWITRILRLDEPASLTCAGRTDAGVHARGQVAHVDLVGDQDYAAQSAAILLRRLARVLPPDVVVRSVQLARPGFDARFAASWRRYAYRLWDGPVAPDPLSRTQLAVHRGRLDLARMNEAASQLLGLRDFGAFCKRREGASTIRTLFELHGVRLASGPITGTIETTVRADAFCHSMVRSLMGGLVAVGSGRRSVSWLAEVAAASTRANAIQVMPAGGLTLEEVGYPADADLAARSLQARAFRVLPSDQQHRPGRECAP